MSKFVILGGKPLSGEISVDGAKNAVLPALAATLLTDRPCVIKNVPRILDVFNFVKILSGLGADVKFNAHRIQICCARVKSHTPDKRLVSSMRGSVVLLGALLGRFRKVALAYPGGDIIGARPIDVHLRAFRRLGATVRENKVIYLSARRLKGNEVFAESSVTGTENMILASVLAAGTTEIKLAAQEPHVVALCNFLNKMGAKISGAGTHTLKIKGVSRLRGAETRVIPDMIQAGSFAAMAATTNSGLIIRNVDHSHMDAVYNKLSEMGVSFDKSTKTLIINRPKKVYNAAVIRTGLYPNLATDLQPPFGVLATQCRGTSIIHDWIFEGRLGYLKELKKMGARVRQIDSHKAEINGPTRLRSNSIQSLDIRSGMTLVIAALAARGRSIIKDIHHIDRGYEKLDEKLKKIGAEIERIE